MAADQHTLIVILEVGLSKDEAADLISAISLLKGISSVEFDLPEFSELDRDWEQVQARAAKWLARIDAIRPPN